MISGFSGLDQLLEQQWQHSTTNTSLEQQLSRHLDHSGAMLNYLINN